VARQARAAMATITRWIGDVHKCVRPLSAGLTPHLSEWASGASAARPTALLDRPLFVALEGGLVKVNFSPDLALLLAEGTHLARLTGLPCPAMAPLLERRASLRATVTRASLIAHRLNAALTLLLPEAEVPLVQVSGLAPQRRLPLLGALAARHAGEFTAGDDLPVFRNRRKPGVRELPR
jgi:hypothetical protein